MVQLNSSSGTGNVNIGLVIIRVTLGLLLLLHGWAYITAESGVPNLIAGSDFSSPVFTWWGENLVAKHPHGASTLIVWIEFLAGVALTLGALVRPVGTLIAVIMLSFALSGGRELQLELVILAGSCALGCAIAGAGRLFGLDSMLDLQLPRWLSWARRAS